MKKFLMIVIVVIAIVLTGCSANSDITSVAETTTSTTASIVCTTEEPTVNEVEYPKLQWPTSGLSTFLPKPEWFTNGEIEYDEAQAMSANIGYVTPDKFSEYVSLLKESGFTDVRSDDQKSYTAYNELGYSIYAEHRTGNVLHMQLHANGN